MPNWDVDDIPYGDHPADLFIQRNLASLAGRSTIDACRIAYEYGLETARDRTIYDATLSFNQLLNKEHNRK